MTGPASRVTDHARWLEFLLPGRHSLSILREPEGPLSGIRVDALNGRNEGA